MALGILGANAIQSFEDESTEAEFANLFYETGLRSLLEDHPWGFAEASASLARDAIPAHPDFAYSYALPPNFVSARRLLTSAATRSGFIYRIRGARLCTSELDPILIYTFRAPEQDFPPLFVRALAWALAGDMAYPITESDSKLTTCLQIGGQMMARARVRDSQQDTAKAIENFPLTAIHSA